MVEKMSPVKQLVRTLANATNQDSGIDTAANVDYELGIWLDKGYRLFSTHFLGNAKVGTEEFPRVLYVLVLDA